MVVAFADSLIAHLEHTLCAVPPERGGALIGAGELAHRLIEDHWGLFSPTSWDISTTLTSAIQADESAGWGTLWGTVHSHPPGHPDPSAQDLRSTRNAIEANPLLTRLVVCIITEGEPGPQDVAVGPGHRLRVWLATRSTRDRITAQPVVARVVPVEEDLATAGFHTAGRPLTLAGETLLFHPVGTEPSGEPLLVGIGSLYPQRGPAFCGVTASGELALLPSGPWDPDGDRGAQLRAARARVLGQLLPQQLVRVEPLAGCLATKRVLIVGLGSVGSRLMEDFVRAGIGHLTLIDADPVEALNLTRTIYVASDVGTPKVDACARRAMAINPAIQLDLRNCAVQGTMAIPEGPATGRTPGSDIVRPESKGADPVGPGLHDLCTAADLVVGATDDPTAQRLLAHHAYAAGTPFLAVGLYREAAAGEIVLSHPAYNMACLNCSVGGLLRGARPGTDYGTGQLVGELALGPAIHLVCEQAALVAIGVLAGPHRPAGCMARELMERKLSLGIVATRPRWELFERIFSEMDSHQLAPQSVWPTVTRNPDCPVCGERRQPPSDELGGRLSAILERLGSEARRDAQATHGGRDVSTSNCVFEVSPGAGRDAAAVSASFGAPARRDNGAKRRRKRPNNRRLQEASSPNGRDGALHAPEGEDSNSSDGCELNQAPQHSAKEREDG